MTDDRMDVLLRQWGEHERADAGPVPPSLVQRAALAPEPARRAWQLRALLPLAAAASVVAIVAGAALVGTPRAAQDVSPPAVLQDPPVLSVDGEDLPNCPDCSETQHLSIYDPQEATSTPVTVNGPTGAIIATSGTGDGATFYISRLSSGECASVVLRLEVRNGGRAVQHELFRPDGVVHDLAVSPDGKSLAYVSTRQQPGMDPGSCGRAEMRLRDLQTGTERTPTPPAVESGSEGAVLAGSLSWSQSGDRLLFITQECCDTTTALHAVRPRATATTGYLHSEVILRDTDIGCVLRAAVQRPADLLLSGGGCHNDRGGIELIAWNEKDRTARPLHAGTAETNSLTYRNGKTLAERDGQVGVLADDGRFTRLTTGHLPAW